MDDTGIGEPAVSEGQPASPLVSIAIPTVNRLEYLKEAVASALAQTYRHIEILIGDEGVSEPVRAWAAHASAHDVRIRYGRNRRRLGLAGNWNALADMARGEFIVIIGDDDRLLPNFVQTLMTARTPKAAVIFANHYLIDALGNRLESRSMAHTRQYHRQQLAMGVLDSPRECVWRNSIPMSAALVRTHEVRRLRFNERLNTPDIEFFVRLSNDGGEFVFVPDYLAEYRIHSGSVTASGLRSEELAQCLLAIPVPADVEPYKREFMSALLVDAVGRCLERGDTPLAKSLLASAYYRANQDGRAITRVRRVMHGLCARLSPFLAVVLYRASVIVWRSCRFLANRARPAEKAMAEG